MKSRNTGDSSSTEMAFGLKGRRVHGFDLVNINPRDMEAGLAQLMARVSRWMSNDVSKLPLGVLVWGSSI